ncbi:MAG: alpha/beta hydrolase fold domain-containing protein [Parachlamydiaceae bacterium]|nr:MAG: alpha/beta hydrolase fold domain-containing protein [Parachlamydiaceae bacterium]
MTAALCMMARDNKNQKLLLQVLINPAPDLSCGGLFERQNDASDYLRWQALQYLSDINQATDPYVSPLLSKDLVNLPKAVILLAEKDELYQDGLKYARKLKQAGNQVYIFVKRHRTSSW